VKFFGVHLPQKVFELLEFDLHNFQPSVNTINQEVQLISY